MAYVYRHIRVDKNVPFYIGIGLTDDKSYKRAYTFSNRNIHWKRIVAKSKFEVDILFDNLSVSDAFKKEIEFISLYGRRHLKNGTLINITDGGDGVLGLKMSKINKEKIALVHGKPVAQYDLDGKFITFYESCMDAQRKVNISNVTICSCANGKRNTKTSGGSIWKWYYGDGSNIHFDKEGYLSTYYNKKKINAYDKSGKIIGTYKSLQSAENELEISKKFITQVLNGKCISAHKIIFRYDVGDYSDIDTSNLYKDKTGENSPMFGKRGELSVHYGKKGINHYASKKVRQICPLTNKIIKIHNSITEAANEIRISGSNISKCCKGRIKECGKFIWEYV